MLPTISIIIPVKNGIATIHQCLDAIYRQTLIKSTEVIIIDSGSSDGTLDIIRRYPVRLFQIPPEEFNHGNTRNFGVRHALGKILVFTVQDAIATDNYWLEQLTTPFNNKEIVGVCGRQMIPRDHQKNPGAWTQTFSKAEYTYKAFSKSELETISPAEKKADCGWDNVTAAYRKETLVHSPFPTTNYSEDIYWAYQMYKSGFTLCYAPQASVWHYHHENFAYRYKRHFIEITNYLKLYQLITYPKLSKSDLVPFYNLYKSASNRRCWWTWYNFRLLFANKLAELVFIAKYFIGREKSIEKYYCKLTKEVPIGKSRS